jgi:type 1 glutamine amidotransferase
MRIFFKFPLIGKTLKIKYIHMNKLFLLLIVVVFLTLSLSLTGAPKYKALIITGQNSHNWKASNPVLKQLLDQTGLFTSDIIITPGKGGDMNTFNPDFSKYNLVVLDYNGDSWSEKTKAAFLSFVRNGGGVVVYHAADNSFPDWKEYNEIIGLGGWGNRNEKSGPYVYYRGNDIVRDDTSKGTGGASGERSEFMVRIRNLDHPITKGLPVNWMHGNDELCGMLRGPALNMEILATAFSPTKATKPAPGVATTTPQRGTRRTGRDEPILMTIRYGKGRIFHTVLGQPDEGGGPAMQCVGFIITFQRGSEWAASGEVTQAVPVDFPNGAGVSLRTDFKEVTLQDDMDRIVNYDIGKSTKPFTDLQKHIRISAGKGEDLLPYEKQMVAVLKNKEATIEAKKLILRELRWMGSDYCIPAVKELAKNAALKDEAAFALASLIPAKK